MTGRPSIFSDDVAADICARLAEGQALSAICKDDAMPGLRTVYRWLAENDAFRQLYARAREDQADTLAAEIVEIADDSGGDAVIEMRDGKPYAVFDGENVQRSKLRVEARKWAASKLKPKVYGDRQTVEVEGNLNVARIPLPAADTEEWAKQHAPKP